MFDFELCEDCCTIVGDEHVSDIVDEHFIEADGSEGCFDNVGYGECCGYVSGAYILTCFTLSTNEL
jgi:hypothetical protein